MEDKKKFWINIMVVVTSAILTAFATVFSNELHNIFTHADIWADIFVVTLRIILLMVLVWALVNVITFKKLAALSAQNNCAKELKELEEVFEDYKKKNDETLRQLISGETTLKGVLDVREDVYKVMNGKFTDLEGRLKDEFYFIRLKSRFHTAGGLDWNYQNEHENPNMKNIYSDDEKIQIRDHKAWKF